MLTAAHFNAAGDLCTISCKLQATHFHLDQQNSNGANKIKQQQPTAQKL